MLRAPTLALGAKALGIDKSTASRRIDGLETSLGAKLFVRTREGMRPSAVGERLRGHAERIEAEMLALTSAAVAGGEEIAGRVRIATTEGLAARLVQAGILELRNEHPGLELEVLGGNRPVDLSRGEADLAIRVTPATDPTLTVRVLHKSPIGLYAAPAYLGARGTPKRLSDLSGHDVLLPSAELDVLPEARLLRELPGVIVSFRSSSLPALVEAALRGHGLVPLTEAWGDGTAGLERVLTLSNIPPRPTWLVVHPDVANRPAVRFVMARIVERFRALARR